MKGAPTHGPHPPQDGPLHDLPVSPLWPPLPPAPSCSCHVLRALLLVTLPSKACQARVHLGLGPGTCEEAACLLTACSQCLDGQLLGAHSLLSCCDSGCQGPCDIPAGGLH